MYKRIFFLAVVLLLSCQFLIADIAPPEGYVKVSRAIVLQTDDDLSEYRFFLISGDLVREVVPVVGEKITLSGLGGGARYSGGTLYAVLRKSMSEFPEKLSPDQSRKLSEALTQDKFPGSTELLRQGFSAEVRKEDAASVTDTEYRISKVSGGIKAEQLPSATLDASPKSAAPVPSSSNTPLFPIAGGLLLVALVIGGGLLFARGRQRRMS
jgi:hypothetical protein